MSAQRVGLDVLIAPGLLKVADRIDPYSPATLELGETPGPLARSRGLDQLSRELWRYVNGQSGGRSYLVCGHRGAGKTTMVLTAAWEVRRACLEQRLEARPMLVRLNGPDLLLPFSDEAAAREETKKNGETKADGAKDEKPARSESEATERMLRLIAASLANAVADEFISSLERGPDVPEKAELLAQLRVDLEGAPSLASLRALWERLDLLERGVLVQRPDATSGPAGRGLREIVALWTNLRASQVIGGKPSEKQSQAQSAKRSSEVSLAIGSALDRLIPVGGGLVAGGLVGASLLPQGGLLASASGAVTAILAATVLKVTSTDHREVSRSIEESFELDRSVESLTRLLPRLVARLREVGLAPVFMVDELDKVDELDRVMGTLTARLKAFVSEQSFFLFLVNRDYYEQLERERITESFPISHTYFTERLFVAYRPEDLHRFLDALILIQGNLAPEQVARAERAKMVLRYVLLERARLHFFDLWREVGRLANERGELMHDSTVERSDEAYRHAAAIQVAVELVLKRPELARRMEEDPYFTQLAIDTLYYPSRGWRAGEERLEAGRDEFERYLDARTKSDPTELDRGLLFGALQDLLVLLSDADLLRRRAGEVVDWRAEGMVDVLPSEPILERRDGDSFSWRYDAHGRALVTTGGPDHGASAAEELAGLSDELDAIDEALRAAGEDLDLEVIGEVRLAKTFPALADVRAMLALANDAPDDPEIIGRAAKLAAEYLANVEDRKAAIASAVAWAVLGARAAEVGPREALTRLCARIGAGELPRESLERILDLVGLRRWVAPESLTPILDLDLFDQGAMLLGRPVTAIRAQPLPEILRAVAEQLSTVLFRPHPPGTDEQALQELWRERLMQFLQRGDTHFEPSPVDLWAAMLGRDPFALLAQRPLPEVSIAEWSALWKATDEDELPPWAGAAALTALGFDERSVTAAAPGGAEVSSLAEVASRRGRGGIRPSVLVAPLSTSWFANAPPSQEWATLFLHSWELKKDRLLPPELTFDVVLLEVMGSGQLPPPAETNLAYSGPAKRKRPVTRPASAGISGAASGPMSVRSGIAKSWATEPPPLEFPIAGSAGSKPPLIVQIAEALQRVRAGVAQREPGARYGVVLHSEPIEGLGEQLGREVVIIVRPRDLDEALVQLGRRRLREKR